MPKDASKYRVTTDLRTLSAATGSDAWPMRNLECKVADFALKTCFATMYWLPASSLRSNVARYVRYYISTRSVHDWTRFRRFKMGAEQFQSHATQCLHSLQISFRTWLDDFIFYAKEADKLLENVEKFLTACDEHILKLSAKRSRLFWMKLKWCGLIIHETGIIQTLETSIP